MSKKSDLYQWAMTAVVESQMLPYRKIEVIELLLADQRLAKFNEEALEPEEGEA